MPEGKTAVYLFSKNSPIDVSVLDDMIGRAMPKTQDQQENDIPVFTLRPDMVIA